MIYENHKFNYPIACKDTLSNYADDIIDMIKATLTYISGADILVKANPGF